MEYFSSVSYFLRHFPRRTLAVLGAALIVALLEMASVSMLLPIIAIGAGGETDNPLIQHVRSVFANSGLPFDFNSLFLALALIFSAKILAELFLGLFIARSSVLIARSFRKRIIDALQNVSWSYLTEKPHGLVVNLLSQEVDRATGIFNAIQRITVSAFMSIGYIIVGMTASFELLLASVAMGAVGILVARPMMGMARRAGKGHVESLRNLSSDLMEGMQALKAFKAMGLERQLLSTLSTANDSFVDANLLKVRAEQFLHASQQLLFVVAVVAGVYAAREFLGVGLIEIGFLALILLRLNAAIAGLLKKLQAIQNLHYALGKVDEFTEEMVQQAERRKGGAKPRFPAPIHFRGVSFARGNRKILDNVDLTIPRKGLTTIIGPSGSGKTTIVDLICGFYSPDEGEVLLGEQNLSVVHLRHWRQMIGYVSQEPVLLHDSIGENIAAFDDTVSKAKRLEALKMAGGEPLLKALSHGLETQAGVAGHKLSGGERQRITIARALARDPKLLILDEPTASVDPASERVIVDAIRRISRRIPVIAISHQAKLAEAADVRYQMSRGKVVKKD
ncbi:MAG: ABC transporter ATP-binding protein [Hyphomicrobiales bacterium]